MEVDINKDLRLLVIGTYRHLLNDNGGYPAIYSYLYEKYRHGIHSKTVYETYQSCCAKIKDKWKKEYA